jgi:Amt family ammonium transporter
MFTAVGVCDLNESPQRRCAMLSFWRQGVMLMLTSDTVLTSDKLLSSSILSGRGLRLLTLMLAFFVGLCSLGTQAIAEDEEADAAAVEVVAEEPAAAEASDEATEESNPPGWNAGDAVDSLPYDDANDYAINTLIMFICAVLVIFMQAGFAMVEVGLNSAKNAVNILSKNVMDFCVGVLLFLFIGYSMMYPGSWISEGYLGMPSAFVSRDAQVTEVDGVSVWETPPAYSDGAYAANAVDFLFQVAFAATAATIVSGAVAGRLKFSGYLVYTAILTGLIYPISGSWKWGGGWLDQMGFQDFAGSVVVHAVGGFAGLIGAIFLGPRMGRYSSDGKSVPIPGHNIPMAALGVFILLVGWYGFNPGSQLTYSGALNAEATAYIALTTTVAAAAGAFVAMLTGWAMFGKPDLTMALNGLLGGLVAITANCDRVSEPEALIIGGVGGLLVVLGILLLDKLMIDDPVGAWPVHGLCGVWGGLATGIFGDLPDGITSVSGFFTVQLISTVAIVGWTVVTMSIVFGALKVLGMLRVSQQEEHDGLDIHEHGLHAYPDM